MELLGLIRRASNYTFLVELREAGAERGDGILAVYKPARGESPLWDFPSGTLYKREVASYLLAKQLGWPRVPPTVVRERAPHGVGALQLFIDAQRDKHYLASGGRPALTWFEIALFDVIVNNADRKSGHCLTDAEGRVWGIDHGLTFHCDQKLRTVIWDFAGEPLPRRFRADVERACRAVEEGEQEARLRELLSRQEMGMLRRRLEAVLSAAWRMPHPTSSWSVPWPPV